jgi:alkanesulfonate monooxygenase SsuD/methylene tetrahydromethanopterin reductase-like flavin-dependent oxidoreductase (luciferase family)
VRPFRFLADGREVADARTLGETARRAEAIGFDALVIPDHLIDQLSLRERLGISSFMLGGVDELAPVVERLAGT